jgi:hypothetical protein
MLQRTRADDVIAVKAPPGAALCRIAGVHGKAATGGGQVRAKGSARCQAERFDIFGLLEQSDSRRVSGAPPNGMTGV